MRIAGAGAIGACLARAGVTAAALRPECVQVLFHRWYSAPRTAEASLRFGPSISCGSWVENFPWTRLPGVSPPAGDKPVIPPGVIVQSAPEEIREPAGDGSFGGK